jgi:hypothetical protein
MVHKTKKSKILAAQRKVQSSNVTVTMPEQKAVPMSAAVAQVRLTNAEISEDNSMRGFFIQDFTRSLVFIGIIFALEFFLYFVTIGK